LRQNQTCRFWHCCHYAFSSMAKRNKPAYYVGEKGTGYFSHALLGRPKGKKGTGYFPCAFLGRPKALGVDSNPINRLIDES